TYFWTAFKDDGGGDFRVGSYVGTGRDNLAIGGLGFRPSYVIVMPDRNERAVQRSSAMVGDYSLMFDNTGPKPNYVQALQADGFQVGTASTINGAGATYFWMAFGAPGLGGPPTALAITSVNGGSHPSAGTAFSVVVQARDASGMRRNVTAATGLSLNLKTGNGPLGGTLTGIIPAGANQ